MEKKIKQLLSRLAEVESLLGDPDILSDQKQYRSLMQEHSYLSEVRDTYEELEEKKKQLADNQLLLKSDKEDLDFAEMLREDISQLEKRTEEIGRAHV
jgi:peptide chain release factor 1